MIFHSLVFPSLYGRERRIEGERRRTIWGLIASINVASLSTLFKKKNHKQQKGVKSCKNPWFYVHINYTSLNIFFYSFNKQKRIEIFLCFIRRLVKSIYRYWQKKSSLICLNSINNFTCWNQRANQPKMEEASQLAIQKPFAFKKKRRNILRVRD